MLPPRLTKTNPRIVDGTGSKSTNLGKHIEKSLTLDTVHCALIHREDSGVLVRQEERVWSRSSESSIKATMVHQKRKTTVIFGKGTDEDLNT